MFQHEITELLSQVQDAHVDGFEVKSVELKPVVVKTPVPVEQKAEAPKAKVIQLKPVAKRPCEKCGKSTLQPTFKYCLQCHKKVTTARKLEDVKAKLEKAKELAEEAKERELRQAKNAIIKDARAFNLKLDDKVEMRIETGRFEGSTDPNDVWQVRWLDIERGGVTASLNLNNFDDEQEEAVEKYQRQQKLEKEKSMEALRLAYFGGNLPEDAIVKVNGDTEIVVRHGQIAVVFQDKGRRERLAREAMERQSAKARERGIQAGLTVIEAPKPDAEYVPLIASPKFADLTWGAMKGNGGGKKGKKQQQNNSKKSKKQQQNNSKKSNKNK